MKIKKKSTVCAVTLVAALASGASAQDSVSKVGLTLPGDAVSPWSTTEQQNAYVVDTAPFQSSWGRTWGIAPVVKSSKSSSTFATSVVSAQAASALVKVGGAYPASIYSFWNTPGKGINGNPLLNDPGINVNSNTLATPNLVNAGFAEFGTTDSGFGYGGIIGASIAWEPNNPNRLFVTRSMVAGNMINDSTIPTASYGFGGVDEEGNFAIRADDFGVTPGIGVDGNNYYRVNQFLRASNTLNLINITGASDTGEHILVQATITHNTPSLVPALVDSGQSHLIGTNWDNEYVYECSSQSISVTQNHLGDSSAHRGSIAWGKSTLLDGSNGTATMIGKDSNEDSRGIIVLGLDECGDVVTTLLAEPPTFLTDTTDGKVLNTAGTALHYLSQTAFRGGNGPTTVGQDRDGNLLACIILGIDNGPPFGGTGSNPDNAMVVAKIDPVTETVVGWTVAAYVDVTGKEFLDGKNGNAVGRLVRLDDATGMAVAGPSMSGPAMDAGGNLWFIASVEHYNRPNDQYDNALMRAVYDPNTFSYQLEKVLEVGQAVRGRNSDTDYAVTFLTIADNNSVSSGSMFSSNIVQCAWNNADSSRLGAGNPRNLGGLVLSASITYDIDDDGSYNAGGGIDESYNTLLFVNPYKLPKSAGQTSETLRDGGVKTP